MPANTKKADPDAVQFLALKGQFLTIEEKVDGTGVSIFFDEQLQPQIWHRGSKAIGKEFNYLYNWVNSHHDRLFDILEDRYIMFGEWMLHKHTIFYDRLPHLFLESDMFDRKAMVWLSTSARQSILNGNTDYIKQVPVIASFRPSSLSQIIGLIGKSRYQSDKWRNSLLDECIKREQKLDIILSQTDKSDLMEGLYIKHEDGHSVIDRYKYVRYEFVDFIVNSGSHLIDREPTFNLTLGGYGDWL